MSDSRSLGAENGSVSGDLTGSGGDDAAATLEHNDAEMVRACALVDLVDDPARRFDLVDGGGGVHRVAVIRIEESIYVIGDRCTHADISLAAGDIDAEECSIECPRHGSTFLLKTGAPTALPAVEPVAVYGVEVIEGDVFVALPKGIAEADPPL